MSYKKYSEEFKKNIVNEYYEGKLGVRLLSKKYNLPSKNYISKWIEEFKEKGIIPKNLVKKNPRTPTKNSLSKAKTAYEKELEEKVLRLEAELAFHKKFEEIAARMNKKK